MYTWRIRKVCGDDIVFHDQGITMEATTRVYTQPDSKRG